MYCPLKNDFCAYTCAFWNKDLDCCMLAKAAHEIPKELKKIADAIKKK